MHEDVASCGWKVPGTQGDGFEAPSGQKAPFGHLFSLPKLN